MVKRIDIFMPVQSQYGVLHYFTKSLYEALKQQGVDCRILEAEYNNPKPFLEALFSNPPDCTLSFNGLLPDQEGRFLADMIHIPHVACLVDSANQFFPLIKSRYTIVTCVDQFSCEFFKGMQFDKTIFMPHAVDKSWIGQTETEKKFDVVMLASCIDYEGLLKEAQKNYEPFIVKAMLEAAEVALSDERIPYVQALAMALDHSGEKINPEKYDFVKMLDDLEQYIRGRERVEILKSITDVPVHVFGADQVLGAGWKKYLGDQKNITIHSSIPFTQALEVMKQSKILLNCCSWIKYGAHERIFTGIAAGGLVLTNRNPFMEEYFKDEESILFYSHKDRNGINEKLKKYLQNDVTRQQIVQKGQHIVSQHHTWNQRATTLLKELPSAIEKVIAAASA